MWVQRNTRPHHIMDLINIESICHLSGTHQLYSSLSRLTWESSNAGQQQCSLWGHKVTAAVCSLQGRAESCSAKSPPRSGLPASAICTQPRGGSTEGRAGGTGRRKKNGSKQMCPTTDFGRKQSSTGSVSAQETSRGKVRQWQWDGGPHRGKGIEGLKENQWLKLKMRSDKSAKKQEECRLPLFPTMPLQWSFFQLIIHHLKQENITNAFLQQLRKFPLMESKSFEKTKTQSDCIAWQTSFESVLLSFPSTYTVNSK